MSIDPNRSLVRVVLVMFLDMPVLQEISPCLIRQRSLLLFHFLTSRAICRSPIEHDLPHVPHKDEECLQIEPDGQGSRLHCGSRLPIAPITGVDGQGCCRCNTKPGRVA